MGILQIAGVGILSVLLILLLRELRPVTALPARLAAGVLLFSAALLLYLPVLRQVEALFDLTGAGNLVTPILRATGIALICEFTASLCRDMGEGTVANGVALFGKLEILVLSLPLIDGVLQLAKELLQL